MADSLWIETMGKPSKPAAGMLKMRDLVKATGLPKSTLLFYVAEGLLPQPVRKGRNVALYLPDCVERARLVRQLQIHKRLTLAEIKGYMAEVKDAREADAVLRLEQAVYGTDGDGARYTEEELLAGSGLSKTALSQLLDAALIVPMEEGVFDEEDMSAARMLARSLSFGLHVRDFLHYPRAARELVEKDLALRARLTRDLDGAEDADRTAELTRSARLYRIYLFDRTFVRAVSRMTSLKG
jgi:DNA-binding transcriptional MerR regulator